MEVIFQLHGRIQELPEDKSGPGLDLQKLLEKIEKKGSDGKRCPSPARRLPIFTE